jgi:hypothetical protein
MEISKAAIGIVASVSLVAGAGGAWLATRGHEPAPTTVQQAPQAATDSAASSTGVEQSEGLVSDAPAETPAITPRPSASTFQAPSRAPAPRQAPARPAKPATTSRQPSATAAAPVPEQHPLVPASVEPPRAVENEPARSAAPPEPQYVDLVVPSEAVIGLQVETPVSSETARVEDRVIAHVTRDVKVGDRVAIPSGAKVQGEVTLVDRGGRLKDRARLGVRFTSIVLADGTRVPIDSDAIYREGDAQATQSAAKIGGGAIGGAIIGGILGGAKGAVIGSTVGGGAGTAAVMAGGRSEATLTSGSPVTVRLQQPATVTVER